VLEPHGTGTRLSLKHTGFKDDNITILKLMTEGWDKNVQKMITHLALEKNGNAKA
jgi:hypothetical protein